MTSEIPSAVSTLDVLQAKATSIATQLERTLDKPDPDALEVERRVIRGFDPPVEMVLIFEREEGSADGVLAGEIASGQGLIDHGAAQAEAVASGRPCHPG